ncbi:hypothetical protein CEXT_179331 [Caerostris extrusa]|uniref:FLZ-type domain-containing protein n=1 Tax=Caerostris extrusa TaxID=172846 RepID=A0AAV4NAZ9_CAEEX|nr:hypothetical protein CEXT_179331 [Caerostris extrusa]
MVNYHIITRTAKRNFRHIFLQRPHEHLSTLHDFQNSSLSVQYIYTVCSLFYSFVFPSLSQFFSPNQSIDPEGIFSFCKRCRNVLARYEPADTHFHRIKQRFLLNYYTKSSQ